MANQVLTNVENNFTKGLLTEFTGLNFPENAVTATDNCEYTIIGDVVRREGIDFELNRSFISINRANQAVSNYKWNNVSGDGFTQIVVSQIGGTLYFYKSSAATVDSPISSKALLSAIPINTFTAIGGSFDSSIECQYSDGNGYLFVFHPSCDPFYCTYTPDTVTGNTINIQIRDFVGIPELISVTTRPSVLTAEHNYNLTNQGWTSGGAWSVHSGTTTKDLVKPTITFDVTSTAGVTNGDSVKIDCTDPTSAFFGPPPPGTPAMSGTVSNFVTNSSITVTITFNYGGGFSNQPFSSWQITQTNQGHINSWFSAIGNFPSNADVWWYFKDTSNLFNPTSTVPNVTLSTTNAPKGHYILNAFNQQRALTSSVSGLTDITTTVRPRTGAWFQGRVWYTGVDASFNATGDEPFTTWTENIYFSQVIVNSSQFGMCYQQNDPSSETLFDLLPTDGGVINIQGCGSIYKLFPLQNALLVFAANGVWYITGSQGIGFSANDYTIVKLSSVRSISSTSFVDVNGLPMFWNEEDIYIVEPAKQGTSLLNSPLHVNPLEVIPLAVDTILTYYSNIPTVSKRYVHGAHDPINYEVQWIFRDTAETDVTSRYTYNKILTYNTFRKSFSTSTVDTTKASINGIVYVTYPGGSNSPPASIKYTATTVNLLSFADEHDTSFADWKSQGGVNFVSTFTTGFKLHGQGQRRFQIPYLYIYSRLGQPIAYKIQSLWNYGSNGNSGKWSVAQVVNINSPNFGMIARRHILRGQGLVLQFKITSVDGMPFDIMGWSSFESQNTGV